MKRGVEGGVSEMSEAMLGADIALKGLDWIQEVPGACFGPIRLYLKNGHRP